MSNGIQVPYWCQKALRGSVKLSEHGPRCGVTSRAPRRGRGGTLSRVNKPGIQVISTDIVGNKYRKYEYRRYTHGFLRKSFATNVQLRGSPPPHVIQSNTTHQIHQKRCIHVALVASKQTSFYSVKTVLYTHSFFPLETIFLSVTSVTCNIVIVTFGHIDPSTLDTLEIPSHHAYTTISKSTLHPCANFFFVVLSLLHINTTKET